jgi:DNA (cytosine-5)-methyltransferase 1
MFKKRKLLHISGGIMGIKMLSFFSGAMGLDLGLEAAGFESVLASEIDKWCVNTIKANRPNLKVLGDINQYSAEDIRKAAGLGEKEEIPLIVGGPPCQAFSTAGSRKGFKDARGNVLLKFVNLIGELKPRFALIENVRGLLSAPLIHRPHNERGAGFPPLSIDELPGGALIHILDILRANGYSVSFNLYNSANFGSPQIRERIIMICSRDGMEAPYLIPTHSKDGSYNLPKWRTFKDAVYDIDKNEMKYIEFPEKRLRYYRLLKPGQYWKHLPEELQKEALGKSYYSGGGKTGFLRRLAWDKPAPTLVTNPAMPATDLAHPIANRPLSIQEYKRIQEFPDSWEVCGSLLDQYRQVGNAVPCSLGKAAGVLIKKLLSGEEVPEFPEFNYSRYRNTDHKSWEREQRKRMSKAEVQSELNFEDECC